MMLKKISAFFYKNIIKTIEWSIMSNWWTILIILSCSIIFERASNKQNEELQKLSTQYSNLALKYKEEHIRNEKQQNIINSQSDVEYGQLIIMKVLGLIPEGYSKVIFQTISDQ